MKLSFNDTEIQALVTQLNETEIQVEDLIEFAIVSEEFEFYGSVHTRKHGFPIDVTTPEFIEKFKRFGGIIRNETDYILPIGLETVVMKSKDGLLDIQRNGVILTINGCMGDVCNFDLQLTRLGEIFFEAMNNHRVAIAGSNKIIEDLLFYAKRFEVNLKDFI